MPRSTLADLIAHVRTLVGDPAGASQQFADDDYQNWLDDHRRDIYYEELEPRLTFTPTATEYLDYFSVEDHWEDDLVLYGPGWVTLTPDLSENHVGHWHWNAHQKPPVWIVGKSFDVYGAAADACLAWLGALKATAVDFQDAQSKFSLNQKVVHLQELEKRLRARAGASSGRLIRADMLPAV